LKLLSRVVLAPGGKAGISMSFQLLVHGFLVPACMVLAYRRALSPSLWSNILPLFAVSGFGMFLTVDGMQLPLRGLLAVALYFPIFVGCVYGATWTEARLLRDKRGGR